MSMQLPFSRLEVVASPTLMIFFRTTPVLFVERGSNLRRPRHASIVPMVPSSITFSTQTGILVCKRVPVAATATAARSGCLSPCWIAYAELALCSLCYSRAMLTPQAGKTCRGGCLPEAFQGRRTIAQFWKEKPRPAFHPTFSTARQRKTLTHMALFACVKMLEGTCTASASKPVLWIVACTSQGKGFSTVPISSLKRWHPGSIFSRPSRCFCCPFSPLSAWRPGRKFHLGPWIRQTSA
mmetsp:Transcript_29086/g.69286  ORF Transcript_29086/g.69286 Transcript_29086/m.69286 type:complete len:239 (-) Transcript_29086:346-1062(-)